MKTVPSMTVTGNSQVLGQPSYQMAGVDLSNKWIELVRNGQVRATVDLPMQSDKSDGEHENDNDDNAVVQVEYGVRMVEIETGTGIFHCEEYVIQIGVPSPSAEPHPLIHSINTTLSRSKREMGQSLSSIPSSSPVVQYKRFGFFVAQLQLVRTLRPPPSAGFAGATYSVPPPYDASVDSFVTGPLRLELRPLVGRLVVDNNLQAPWDVYHNVSPADTRGHFLLLPTLDDSENNCRGQVFTRQDAHDLVHLASSVLPHGSILLGYNSVGAGASQNHIHCHAWPSPPVPLLEHDNDGGGGDDDDGCNNGQIHGWSAYPVSRVEGIYDFCDLEGGKVEVSFLQYPVFCILLSASTANLDILGIALATCLDAIGEAPHNIGVLNRQQNVDKEGSENDSTDETFVDVYLFVRSKERSELVPTHKLGISEMMGVFHAQSSPQLETWASSVNDETKKNEGDGSIEPMGMMERALLDVTILNEAQTWEKIKDRISALS